eukprot:CAMPEP_0202894880 /NCGR_PEP_ID=MMETSP1392-20130828/4179_1 /ASSEMBLY_ACC=CAM_ASM_000868 /TAXON_ID=225041 /ORGANISM="Chlamydomonas chlamydogama, Strain SAG 11-48b" /LENGTH=206 /DNA_ID=CAMNT_0049579699 /DNA_START=58 /DNA_END=675 /DNA_ORIENTATION=-
MALTMKANQVPRLHTARPVVTLPRRSVVVRAQAAQEKSALAKFSDGIGMPTEDGVFGFTPFAEMWVGRWSMLGFVSSIVVEFTTGQGTLQQIGLPSPSGPLLAAMVVLFGGATLAGTVSTVQKVTQKKMSRREIDRYKNFLGLNNADDYKVEAAAMKKRGDFTTPGIDTQAIEQARAAGTPADSFLATNEVQQAEAGAREMKAGAA